MRKSVFFLLLLCITAPAFAQSTFKIKVVDKTSNEPLAGASVFIKEEQKQLITDVTGSVSLNASKQIIISFIGYKTVDAVASNNQTIALQAIPINLTDVTVSNASAKGSINTLAKIDLDTRPVKSSQDLMRIVPGLFIAQHQGGGKAEQIFLRGFDVDHGTDIQISVDGIPVNMVSHAHGQGYADLHFLIPETVATIDYGKGPYNSNHGNLATAGYANFSTLNRLPHNEVKVEAGSFNTLRNVLLLNLTPQKNKLTNAYFAGEFLYSDGPFISKEAFKRFSGFTKLNSQLNTNNLLQLEASAMSSNWSASGQIPERAIEQGLVDRFGSIDPAEGGVTNRYNATAKLITSLQNSSSIENQLYFIKYNFNLLSNFTFFANDSINGDRIKQYESRNVYGYQNKFIHTAYFKNGNAVFSAGTGIRLDDIQDIGLSHMLNRETELKKVQYGNIFESNISAYADEKIEMNKWLINIGVRADYFNFHYTDKLDATKTAGDYKATISPKLNIYYTVNNRTQLYFKTGKGFHSNDTRVILAGNSKEILPACYGTDLGIIFKPTPQLLINVAAWYLYFQSELVYGGDEGVVEPSGKTERVGIDFSARYQINKFLTAFTDVNIAKARTLEDPKGQNYLPLVPTFTSTGGITAKGKKEWNGSLRYRYIADRPANADNTIIAKGYFITDANVNYTTKKFELGLGIENLLNVKWNEAQFETVSRLKNETNNVDDLNFTPGTPFSLKAKISIFF